VIHAALLVATLASAQTPEIAIVEFEGIGILFDEQEELQKQLFGEIEAAGAKGVGRLQDWVPGCLDDPGCLAEEPQSAFLSVEVTRVGPMLQVDVRMVTRDGNEVLKQSSSLMQGDPLLGDAFKVVLPDLPPPKAAEVVETPPGEGEGEGEGNGGDDKKAGEPLFDFGSVPMWGWAGAGSAVAGVVLFGAGAAIAAGDAAILEDPASLGDDKASARVRGPIAVIAAVVGVAAIAGGATVFIVSLGDE
jgi:hypothetical protein